MDLKIAIKNYGLFNTIGIYIRKYLCEKLSNFYIKRFKRIVHKTGCLSFDMEEECILLAPVNDFSKYWRNHLVWANVTSHFTKDRIIYTLWDEAQVKKTDTGFKFITSNAENTYAPYHHIPKVEISYKSGLIRTHTTDIKYGRVVANIKVANSDLLFPAFWLLSKTHTNKNAPYNKEVILPEVDIMEYKHSERELYLSYHAGLNYEPKYRISSSNVIKGIDFSSKFYTFEVKITKRYIKWYINGIIVKVVRHCIPKEDMYIILNDNLQYTIPYLPEFSDDEPNKNGMNVSFIRYYKQD